MRVRIAVLLAGPIRNLMKGRGIAVGAGLQGKEAAIVAASLAYQALLKPLITALA
jgi:hypothetical protein